MENKKKILYIVTQAEWGGAQKYVFDLATNLAADFDIIVAAGPDGENQELFKKLKNKNIPTHFLKHLRRAIRPCQDLLAILEIRSFLKDNNFDILHLNSSKAGMIGGLVTWSIRKKQPALTIIYTAHGWIFLEPRSFLQRYFYLLLEKISAKLRDKTIVLSEKEKMVALKNKIGGKNQISIIPNGIQKIDFLEKNEARKKINLDTNDFVIGTIANLYKTKGLNILIEAIKILKTKNLKVNFKTVIIGEGPERKKLEEKIKTHHLENEIMLAGFIQDASKYLQAFDIFVLSSLKEGFPFSILEALSAGLPIIATKVGANPEIITDKINGLLVDPAKPEKLAEAISSLILDEKLRTQLRQAALNISTKYGLQKMLESTKELYN